MSLLAKITDHTAIVGVIGLGYVGLPLAVLQARTGYRVFGVDEAAGKVKRINRGENYISDVDDAELRQMVSEGRLRHDRFRCVRGVRCRADLRADTTDAK